MVLDGLKCHLQFPLKLYSIVPLFFVFCGVTNSNNRTMFLCFQFANAKDKSQEENYTGNFNQECIQ